MNETNPPTWKLVPVTATPEMAAAIEAAIDSQMASSGMNPRYMFRQDGDAIYAAALDAAPQPGWPGWSSATAPGPDGMQHCIAVPGMPSAHDDISAQLREYASNPGYSHNDYADTMRQAADAIDAGLDTIRAWSTPAPVQQAAPSEPDAYMVVLSGGEPVSVNFQKIHADWKLKEWESAGEVVPLYRAAPAQPVGLSEQDRLDAARYKQQRDSLLAFAQNAPVSSGVCCCGDEMDKHSSEHSAVDQWDHSIRCFAEEFAKSDAAILAAKEAP